MKNKEEVQQLAEKYADGYSTDEAHASYIAFQDGYFKCQQDMAEKYTEQDMIKFAFDTYYQEDMAKKYTKDDMLKSFWAGVDCEADNGKNFEQFINSLH